MPMDGQTPAEVVAPVTPPTTEVQAPETPITPETTAVESKPGQEGQEPAAFTPDWKFKVHDQEKEMDEWVRSAVKDPDTLKKARELFEKAHGLDVVKPKLAKVREDFEVVNTENLQIKEALSDLKTHVKNDDFGSFFQAFNIPKETIFRWVAKELQYENLPPEEKARYDEQMELRRTNAKLQKDLESKTTEIGSVTAQAKQQELDEALSAPEISKIAQAFDAKNGKGAFAEEIVHYAIARETRTKRKVSASEAVQGILGLMGATPGVATPRMPLEANPQVVTQPKPIVPNIKGKSGASPTKKQPGNLKELEAHAAARIAELEG